MKDAYLELLNKVTLEDCPSEFTDIVLAQSGIISESRPMRLVGSESHAERIVFCLGNALALVLIVFMIMVGINDHADSVRERMARNGIAAADRAANVVREVITVKERREL